MTNNEIGVVAFLGGMLLMVIIRFVRSAYKVIKKRRTIRETAESMAVRCYGPDEQNRERRERFVKNYFEIVEAKRRHYEIKG